MTLPDERTRAVAAMGDAVARLCSALAGKGRVPRELLLDVTRCLRHYPTHLDLWRSAQALPDTWGDPEE